MDIYKGGTEGKCNRPIISDKYMFEVKIKKIKNKKERERESKIHSKSPNFNLRLIS